MRERERGQREQTRSFGRYDARRHGCCLTDNNSKQLANNFWREHNSNRKISPRKHHHEHPTALEEHGETGSCVFMKNNTFGGDLFDDRREKRSTCWNSVVAVMAALLLFVYISAVTVRSLLIGRGPVAFMDFTP